MGITSDARIFAITRSELVEVEPGSVRLVRDLTDLGTPTGLAVGPTGALFVAYEDTETRLSGIQTIDPGSGTGIDISSLGSFGRIEDLEFVSGGSLAALAERPGGDRGELYIHLVDANTGVSVAAPGVIAIGSALGVSAIGDLVAAAAFGWQGTAARALVVATGDVSLLDLPLFANQDGACAHSPECNGDLIRSDLAFDDSGRILLSVNGFPGSPAWTTRLFRVQADGSSEVVSEGAFSELQVFVPEPGSVQLLLGGVLALAVWRRSLRRSRAIQT